MNAIIIKDLQGNQVNGANLLTYVIEEPLALKDIEFPIHLSDDDNESMLHALQLLSQDHEEINRLLREEIAEEDVDVDGDHIPEGCLPWLPFVKALVRNENLYTIEWGGEDVCITKLPLGIEVKDHTAKFFFSFDNFFLKLFIDTVGESVFAAEPVYSSSFLPEWSYLGKHDIAEILEPYKTIFVPEACLPALSQNLKTYCQRVEAVLDKNLFIWQKDIIMETFLVEVVRKNVELDD